MAGLPSGTVTFLFTDIEGSTRLWEEHPQAMEVALARHDALLRQAIESHGGHIFKTIGDQFCATFATAPDALATALTAQRALSSEPWGEVGPVRVRMALHTGAAEQRDGDYFGPALSRVARLLAAGHGGQILLSLSTETVVRDWLPTGASLRDLGEHRLRDLARPERIFQLLHSDLPADFPPLRSLEAFAHNLPVQLTSFIGREREMAEVRRLLMTTHLLTLTGAGGCGKTRLALQVAADLVEEYADGVRLVELAALSDPVLVAQAVAATLGVREEPGRTLTQALGTHLRAKSLLLVLDNCEHLVAACAELAETLLRSCPHLRILATSREALGIAGETPYQVPSLLPPDSDCLARAKTERVSILVHSDAARLFIERAQTLVPRFSVTDQSAPAVAQVCQRLDGIPLALELAAARVKVLSVEQIAERLDDRFRLLKGGSRTALPRQQTLQALIDWSYDLLTEVERTLLRRLSVFAGGWTLEAAEAVCAGEAIERWEVLDLLSRLVDKSLVLVEEGTGEKRYRMLETIRQYGLDRLREREEEAEVRERHRDYFLQIAEEAQPRLAGAEQAEWLERLETEHDNLRIALQWCQVQPGGAVAGLRLAGALGRFWEIRGHLSEGREHLTHVLARTAAVAPMAARVNALHAAAALASMQDDYGLARALYTESLAIQRDLGDRPGTAVTLGHIGHMHQIQGDVAAARPPLEESLAITRELGQKAGIAWMLYELGWVTLDLGEYASANTFFQESLALRRELGDQDGTALLLLSLGLLALYQQDYSQAYAHFAQSSDMFRELGDRRGFAWSLHRLGDAVLLQGDLSRAWSLHEEAAAIFEELGIQRGVAWSLHRMGQVRCAQSDYARARALFSDSLATFRAFGDSRAIAECLEGLARVACREGQSARAAQIFGAAEAHHAVVGARLSPVDHADHDRHVADLRAALGDHAFAAARAEGRAMTLEAAINYALEDPAPT